MFRHRVYRKLGGEVQQVAEKLSMVIPGRAEGANPESRRSVARCFWIPGPALRAVPE